MFEPTPRKLYRFSYMRLAPRQMEPPRKGKSYTTYAYSERLSSSGSNWVQITGGTESPEVDLGPAEGEVWLL